MDADKIAEFLYDNYKDRIKSFGGNEVQNIINERIRDELALQVLKTEHQNSSEATINIAIEDDSLKIEI
jgi:ATP-dependent Clp protease ATP-binding subunit ClpA